jgi:hypothetical protein
MLLLLVSCNSYQENDGHAIYGKWYGVFSKDSMSLEVTKEHFTLLTFWPNDSAVFESKYEFLNDTICLYREDVPECHLIEITSSGHLKIISLSPSDVSIPLMNVVEFNRVE